MSLRARTDPVPGTPGTSGSSQVARRVDRHRSRIETPGPAVRAPAFERLRDDEVEGAQPAAALRLVFGLKTRRLARRPASPRRAIRQLGAGVTCGWLVGTQDAAPGGFRSDRPRSGIGAF